MVSVWLINYGITSLDRLFIKHFCGLSNVASYTMALQLTSLINLVVVTPFYIAWSNLVFATERTLGIETEYNRTFALFTYGSTWVYVVFVLGASEIYYFLISKEYSLGLSYIPYLALVPLLNGLVTVTSSGIYLERRNDLVLYANLGTAVIAVLTNYIFVSVWGALGVAWASVLTLVLYNIVVYRIAQRLHPVAFDLKPLRYSLLVILVFIGLHRYISPDYEAVASANVEEVLGVMAFKLVAIVGSALLGIVHFRKNSCKGAGRVQV
jgi:O-antigen/teichoic acid export membrane protein